MARLGAVAAAIDDGSACDDRKLRFAQQECARLISVVDDITLSYAFQETVLNQAGSVNGALHPYECLRWLGPLLIHFTD